MQLNVVINHPMMVVSRERASRRAGVTARTTPLAVVVSSVPVILSQQVGGVESEHWSGAM